MNNDQGVAESERRELFIRAQRALRIAADKPGVKAYVAIARRHNIQVTAPKGRVEEKTGIMHRAKPKKALFDGGIFLTGDEEIQASVEASTDFGKCVFLASDIQESYVESDAMRLEQSFSQAPPDVQEGIIQRLLAKAGKTTIELPKKAARGKKVAAPAEG